ncbi:MAG: 23S rRNA (pseudouridine(1915)-N(3))-methyltransferase RlmH [Bacilli bacterium]|nr:23S rRNA (pseudouridine(1915)-N(3))-methyltransferase RlmH [Bacilli bacterium]
MIKIICSGKLKEKYLVDLVDDYLKRISKYHKIELIEIKDENSLEKEKESILKHIGRNEFIITLDIKGTKIDSVELAKLIDQSFIVSSTITFIIGSSIGIHDDIKKLANKSISFSNMTFPHGLFRGMLLEQIYRSFKINNNETYHK